MIRQNVKPSSAEMNETKGKPRMQEERCRHSSHTKLDKELQTYPIRAREDYFRQLFGFQTQDLTSWERLVRLLCRPCDPATLGTIRLLFGFLLTLDIIQERGLATADSWWGNENECRFPLFNFLRPLPLQWMYVVYLVMLSGAFGIMLGFKMRLSSALFLASYWYVFFLNKTTWNNHSYLFGIIAFLLAMSDANRYCSIDGLLNSQINNAHIPLWNYTLMRTQIFIVYFIAGLKKLDMDWISGYSMQSLAHHWVFDPFKILLTESQIDLHIVHLGGLLIDLSLGFLLFLNKTRMFALTLSSAFHLMNSQLFSIGMFPYAMLVTQLCFCDMSWPRRFVETIPSTMRLFSLEFKELQPSSHCIYAKEYVKTEILSAKFSTAYSAKVPPTTSTWRHKMASLFTLLFIAWQIFLPYSHGITKGYNNWTNGLYGYSWDMMVHSWSVQHIRITFYDQETGQSGYLDPNVWTGGNKRWSSHGDMVKQYAHCIAENLKSYGINNVSIYFDIWKSLNYRFQQRMVDPRIDIITAEWSPFRTSSWLMPLMVDLSDWRKKLEQIQTSLNNETHTDVVFVADFPGMCLENYVQPDFGTTTITVLAGKVMVELIDEKKNITLGPDQSLQVIADTFHNVYTISETPSCYMYMFVNTTEAALMKSYRRFEDDYNKSASLNETLQKYNQDPNLPQYQQMLAAKEAQRKEAQQTVWEQLKFFLKSKYNLIKRSIHLSTGAVYCLATNSSFDDFLNATYNWEIRRGDKDMALE